MAVKYSSGEHSSVITRLQSILSVRYDAVAGVQAGSDLSDPADFPHDGHCRAGNRRRRANLDGAAGRRARRNERTVSTAAG
jgi:hypothetical protein